jgi:hypothetical protein
MTLAKHALVLTIIWRQRSRVTTALLIEAKRKGLQLALEPLNGQGIAGYVPEP